MGPVEQYDYTENDNLEKILEDPALAPDKYGTVSKKTVSISCRFEMSNGHYTYYASSALLGLLHRKYGNITFKEAYAKHKKGEK